MYPPLLLINCQRPRQLGSPSANWPHGLPCSSGAAIDSQIIKICRDDEFYSQA